MAVFSSGTEVWPGKCLAMWTVSVTVGQPEGEQLLGLKKKREKKNGEFCASGFPSGMSFG